MTSEILSGYSMDFTMQIHYAQRADGTWFSRCQYRDSRYGYKWSAWKVTRQPHPEQFLSSTGKIARLPKVAA